MVFMGSHQTDREIGQTIIVFYGPLETVFCLPQNMEDWPCDTWALVCEKQKTKYSSISYFHFTWHMPYICDTYRLSDGTAWGIVTHLVCMWPTRASLLLCCVMRCVSLVQWRSMLYSTYFTLILLRAEKDVAASSALVNPPWPTTYCVLVQPLD